MINIVVDLQAILGSASRTDTPSSSSVQPSTTEQILSTGEYHRVTKKERVVAILFLFGEFFGWKCEDKAKAANANRGP
jgi:hypothetical protein